MDYTDAIHIIPDAAGPDAWTNPAPSTGGDAAIWATEDDYRQWSADPGKKARGGGGDGGGGSSATRRSRGIGKMFFKTKLCCNFRAGTCPYVTNCNFAHGMEELRSRKPRAARTGVPPSYIMDVAGTSAPPPAAAPVSTAETLPTPTLRRLLGCQTAAVNRRPGLPRTGAWNPAAIGLPSAEVLNMNGYGGGFYSPDEGESSSN